MHKIRFPLGAPPETPLGKLTESIDPLAVFNGGLLLRDGRGRGGEGPGRQNILA